MRVEHLGSGHAIHVASLERHLEMHRAIRLELDAGIGKVDLMRFQADWTEADGRHDGPGQHGSARLFDHEAAPTAFKSWTMLVAV